MSQACHRTSSTFNGLRNKLLSSHLYGQPGCGSMQINMAAPASADCPGLRCPELDHSYRFPLSRWDFLGFRLKTWQTRVASSFQDYFIKIQKESWQTQLTNTWAFLCLHPLPLSQSKQQSQAPKQWDRRCPGGAVSGWELADNSNLSMKTKRLMFSMLRWETTMAGRNNSKTVPRVSDSGYGNCTHNF